MRETTESLAARLDEGGGAALEAEGALIGALLWAERDEALFLGRLAVDPRWRGRGAAHVLLAAAEAEARRRGLARLRLNVRLALEENRRLFEAWGFLPNSPGRASRVRRADLSGDGKGAGVAEKPDGLHPPDG